MTTTTSTGTTDPVYTPKQRRLIERYRDFNVEHIEWWDCVYDDFVETAAAKGFVTTTEKLRFSGFWSQGDGASFTGYVDVPKFIEATKGDKPDPYPWVSKLLAAGGEVTISIERRSYHYVHENTCWLEYGHVSSFGYLLDTFDREDDPRVAVLEQWDKALDADLDQLEKDIEATRIDLCRELYRSLNDEHDYLTSDEAVWDAIEANELDQEEEDDGTTEG